jgi:hypothetical protein
MPRKRIETEAVEAVDLPPAPPSATFDFSRARQVLKPETFFEFVTAYPDWEACAIYLYRLWPVIDRKLTGHSEKYIDVFSEPITEMDILRKHGSGKYLLHFNDSNRPGGLKQVASCKLELNDPMYEPILDHNEVVEGIDANRSYIEGQIARGKWKKHPPAEVLASVAVPDNLTASLASALQRLAPAPVEQKEPPRPDPYEIGLRIAELAQRSAPKPSTDPLDLALKIVSLVRERKESDPLELYAKVADIIEARAARYAGKAPATDWSTVLLDVAKALPAFVQALAAMRMSQAVPGQQMSPAAVPLSTAQAEPLAPAATSPTVLLEQLKPYLLKAISAGQGGDEFAAGIVTFYGEDKYREIADLGMEGIIDALKRQADIWSLLSPFESEVRSFVADFLAYGQPDAEGAIQ